MLPGLYHFFTSRPKRAVLFAGLWTLCILIACLLPGNEFPRVRVPMADKWVHILIFTGFSFFWLCTRKNASKMEGIIALILSVAFGYAIELLQGSGITSGRSFDRMDVWADGIGSFLGVVLYFLLQKQAFRSPNERP